MKKRWLVMVCFFGVFAVRGSEGSFRVDTIASMRLAVGYSFTINLIFPYPIVKADLGSGVVTGRRWDALPNVLLLKAGQAHFSATNISVYCTDGQLYSFTAFYSDTPVVLNLRIGKAGEVLRAARTVGAVRHEGPGSVISAGSLVDTGDVRTVGLTSRKSLPGQVMSKAGLEADVFLMDASKGGVDASGSSGQGFLGTPFLRADVLEDGALRVMRASCSVKARSCSGKVVLSLHGVFIRDQLLWLGFRAWNGSLIDFVPGEMRFSLRESRHMKRSAVQALDILPVGFFMHGGPVLTGGGHSEIAVAFRSFMIPRGKRLEVEWKEKDGRILHLRVSRRDLLKARKLGL